MIVLIALALSTLIPSVLSAQRLVAEGIYYSYGYNYTPWQLTTYNAIELRIKCEGEQVRGAATGPIRWVVEFHNRNATQEAHFDFVIQSPDSTKPVSLTGRSTIKPNKTLQRITVVPTFRCDEGVRTTIGNVRMGPDINGAPYVKPDRE